VPGVPRRGSAGHAVAYVRLRPRGVEPYPGGPARPLARREQEHQLRRDRPGVDRHETRPGPGIPERGVRGALAAGAPPPAGRVHRNRRLARAISCTGWAEFRSMLEYKAQWHGRTVVAVDRWYPSSKTCSACGHLLAELSLSTRTWQCPSCGTQHDRDVNAAKNILAAGLAAGTRNGANACGGDVRRARATRTRPPVKQEPRPAREGPPSF